MNEKTKQFIDSLFEGLSPDTYPEPIAATLFLDGQAIATGQFVLEGRQDGVATFQASSGDIPRIPKDARTILKLNHREIRMTLEELNLCVDDTRKHVHLRFEVTE
jgi:hypothetical protein